MGSEPFMQEGYELIGLAMSVYNKMYSGFSEAVYQECLGIELDQRNIPYQVQPRLSVYYNGQLLKSHYIPDLVVYKGIVVELKTVTSLDKSHIAQLVNYLRVTRLAVGYLINFGNGEKLEYKRILNKYRT